MPQQENHLILVKHSLPEIVPSIPAKQWHLSATGRQRCEELAVQLKVFTPDVIITSHEPKAQETGQTVAKILGTPCTTAPNLHEHDRTNEKYVPTKEQFENRVARFFAHAQTLVFGQETADDAHARFASAVSIAITHNPGRTVAIVAHGTVITLFLARACGLQPFPLWKRLGLPSFAVLSLPAFNLRAIVESV